MTLMDSYHAKNFSDLLEELSWLLKNQSRHLAQEDVWMIEELKERYAMYIIAWLTKNLKAMKFNN